jgi:hypothetical protein
MSAAHPSERRIALVRPVTSGAESATPALQLIESMLWAFQGTMRSNWISTASAEAADVIVIAAGDERLRTWQNSGKPIILISAPGESVPTDANVLVYPFRATDLMRLLNELDVRFSAPSAPAETNVPRSEATGGSPWSFVEALRTLREVQNSAVWLTALRGSSPLLWLKGDGSEYSADANTLQDIRRGTLALGALRLRQGASPPAYRGLRPAAELEWFAGFHASTELAPGIDPGANFRITRWPNFGLIRPLPSQIRITALLAAGPLTLDQLTRRSEIPRIDAIRTLNALDACSLLTVVDPAAAAMTNTRSPAPQPPGGLAAFLKLVRRKLGLSGER